MPPWGSAFTQPDMTTLHGAVVEIHFLLFRRISAPFGLISQVDHLSLNPWISDFVPSRG